MDEKMKPTELDGWKYYDFDRNWDVFFQLWRSPSVQLELDQAMIEWCSTYAYFVRDKLNGGLVRPTWKKGDDLWKYSQGDYHSNYINENANQYMDTHRVMKHNIASIFAITGLKFREDDEDDDGNEDDENDEDEDEDESPSPSLYVRSFFAVEALFQPPPNSLRAQILCGGQHFLDECMHMIALVLFPGRTLAKCNRAVVLIVEDKLVFDFMAFYFANINDKDYAIDNLSLD
jgi:hypothetical protein